MFKLQEELDSIEREISVERFEKENPWAIGLEVKECSHCGDVKETRKFSLDAKSKDRHQSICKKCSLDISRTKEGLINKIHSSQAQNSKKRGHVKPNYTSKELKVWLKDTNFDTLYDEWVASDYDTMKIPSCDRLDDSKPYTFDNIQVITWEENKYKNYENRKAGINREGMSPVISTNISTKVVTEYYSINNASRITGAPSKGISECCHGKNSRKTSGGFTWKFKTK